MDLHVAQRETPRMLIVVVISTRLQDNKLAILLSY